MHLPLYALLLILHIPMNEEWQGKLSYALPIATLVLMILMIPICLVNIIVMLKSVFKDNVDPTKITMEMKLCLIPWYVLNFIIGFAFVSAFLNPFLMIAIPIIIALLVASTYVFMLTTSVGDIAYFAHTTLRRKGDISPAMTVAVIFLFIFCLDVIGAIILYKKSPKSPVRS